MRILLLALFSLLCISCASTSKKPVVTSVEIEDIKPRYIETQDFMRISEYFTGADNHGNRLIIRTNKEERSGYYFILRLDKAVRDLPPGTYVEGEFYTPKSQDVQVHTFTFPSQLPTTKEIFIGLTGEDWPVKNAVPSAWKFTVKNSKGDVLGSKQSFLWSM